MGNEAWVTLVAYDTPFLAQMVADHLDQADIDNRTLSDSGGGNLPHISFGSGGYRVQVHREDESAARATIAAVPEAMVDQALEGFDGEADQVIPHRPATDELPLSSRPRPWVRLLALVVVVILAWLVLAGSPVDIPRFG